MYSLGLCSLYEDHLESGKHVGGLPVGLISSETKEEMEILVLNGFSYKGRGLRVRSLGIVMYAIRMKAT